MRSNLIYALGKGLTWVGPVPIVIGAALWLITGASWWVPLGIATGVLILAASAALMPLYSWLLARETPGSPDERR